MPTPVYFEITRGLLWRDARMQFKTFHERWLPAFSLVNPTIEDWRVAARLWADTRRSGLTLSDIDLLLVALAQCLSATLITADDDFDALGSSRENWRLGSA